MSDIQLGCACGAVTGALSNAALDHCNHLVCYCKDCQKFANHLGLEPPLLDAHGGTEVVQASPAWISITAGQDHLRALQLTPKGLLRWYTDCCRTPVANTVSAGLPFAGIVAAFIRQPNLNETFGPVKYRIQGQDAINPPADLEIDPAFPRAMVAKIMVQIAMGRLRGHHRPSPFFGEDGRPLVKPEILAAPN
jgi:hypothetical protein